MDGLNKILEDIKELLEILKAIYFDITYIKDRVSYLEDLKEKNIKEGVLDEAHRKEISDRLNKIEDRLEKIEKKLEFENKLFKILIVIISFLVALIEFLRRFV